MYDDTVYLHALKYLRRRRAGKVQWEQFVARSDASRVNPDNDSEDADPEPESVKTGLWAVVRMV